MRRALTRAASVTLLVCALFAPSIAHAADPRPVVRVVLVTGGETPAWFEGFVKHLQSELGLRGIEVAVARGASAPLVRGGEGLRPRADAELVVEAPSALRPVLRFSVAPAEGTPPAETPSSRVRNVNLAGVPNDGYALAMAVSADELMRSNWPRAVPSAAPAATAEGKGSSAPGKEPAASNPPEAVTRPPEAATRGEESKPKARAEPAGIEASAAPEADQGATSADATSTAFSTSAEQGTSRVSVGAAAAGEAFAGKQMQFGPDLRVGFRLLPRLELGVRAGWRRVAPRDTPSGSIDGSAIVAGGALDVLVLGGGRAALWLVGRADLLRAVYTGRPRDSTSLGDTQSANGFVVSAGPCGRIAVSRTVSLEGELLAGASPLAATATDTWNPMVSTNGAAIMASLGLSLGL
jgi:hypothetical protein